MSLTIEDEGPTFVESPDARAKNPADLAYFRKLDTDGVFDLLPRETWWSEHYDHLFSHGYQLRRRFRPGWTRSWADTNLNPFHCEDAYNNEPEQVIDAKRLSDGAVVVIKKVRTDSREVDISRMLSAPERLRDVTNHCVPILDYVKGKEDELTSFLVMPLLRKFDSPPFYFVEEVVDFVRQTLEGLAYIHDAGVGHCDLSDGNIMMDGSLLFPDGFHPSWQTRSKKNIVLKAPHKSRHEAGPVKYYIIDFGYSWHYSDPNKPRLANALMAQDQEVPELQGMSSYDPYPADVWTLGHVYKRNFLDKYSNLNFLKSLVDRMMQQVPSDRPSASEALDEFKLHISKLRTLKIHWRLHKKDESWLPMVFRDARTAVGETRRHSWAIIRKEVPPRTAAVVIFPLSVVVIVFVTGPQKILRFLRGLT